ncbi:hypothetical protein [Shewanella algae]|uniref:hypothetical protein n=1 Tax=Shewanella algae TaxID=38313 RepID=UPI0011836E55|nr:hypothetical protein [Shewanella algae]MBO2569441.1 hypothetical protein [Shewanella algae]MBO2590905.1 hypothetical protein [Shewanella algae]MBO2658263.1 hypothetical protein [Shewanella algae]MBO2662407.1 hypothetical protein [Shewanella algae]MCL1052336.1 hypothetical protein [Shewanella algae]
MDFYTYSLEESISKIENKQSQRHFEEVIQCYSNGCYRSATVILWSVVVTDALFKLRKLSDVYGDKNAEKILLEIEKEQQDEPTSSKWEKNILKMLFDRTKLLSTADLQKLETIQKHRHLSAHPILTEESILFEPTPEMVRSDIRNALDTLLTRTALLNKNIVGKILEDLESVKELFPKKRELKTYLDSKYLKSISEPIMAHIFRSFWKFVFTTKDERAMGNLDINFRALEIVYETNPKMFCENIKSENEYYSNLNNDDKPLEKLVLFLSTKKTVYISLKKAARLLIDKTIEKDFSLKAISFFKSESPEEHIEKLIELIEGEHKHNYGIEGNYVTNSHYLIIKKYLRDTDNKKLHHKLCITCYGNSADFDRADIYYDRYIKNQLNSFTLDEIKALLDKCNQNSQLHWYRKRAEREMLSIMQAAYEIDSDFDFSGFDNLPKKKFEEQFE